MNNKDISYDVLLVLTAIVLGLVLVTESQGIAVIAGVLCAVGLATTITRWILQPDSPEDDTQQAEELYARLPEERRGQADKLIKWLSGKK